VVAAEAMVKATTNLDSIRMGFLLVNADQTPLVLLVLLTADLCCGATKDNRKARRRGCTRRNRI
jgi:hypothetical protein